MTFATLLVRPPWASGGNWKSWWASVKNLLGSKTIDLTGYTQNSSFIASRSDRGPLKEVHDT